MQPKSRRCSSCGDNPAPLFFGKDEICLVCDTMLEKTLGRFFGEESTFRPRRLLSKLCERPSALNRVSTLNLIEMMVSALHRGSCCRHRPTDQVYRRQKTVARNVLRKFGELVGEEGQAYQSMRKRLEVAVGDLYEYES